MTCAHCGMASTSQPGRAVNEILCIAFVTRSMRVTSLLPRDRMDEERRMVEKLGREVMRADMRLNRTEKETSWIRTSVSVLSTHAKEERKNLLGEAQFQKKSVQ